MDVGICSTPTQLTPLKIEMRPIPVTFYVIESLARSRQKKEISATTGSEAPSEGTL
jgi:hypothetical protein